LRCLDQDEFFAFVLDGKTFDDVAFVIVLGITR
jgi:hypothetical protein